jgi:protein disulfide-isomerase A6
LCGQYNVHGFPTIKIFGSGLDSGSGSGGETPEDYNGERTANGIVQAAQRAAMRVVQVDNDDDKKLLNEAQQQQQQRQQQ